MTFADRKALEAWYKKHHTTALELWLLVHKKASGLPSVAIEDALDVALCHGWIDAIRKPFDATSYLQRYTPRGPRSIWSVKNRDNIERLIAEGRMTPAGHAAVAAAKADGRWDKAYHGSAKMSIPDDLLAAIDIGSNSFRLEIAQLQGGKYKRIEYFKETVRLGGGLDAQGHLQQVDQRGPSGIQRVDLYATKDDGRTWVWWSKHAGNDPTIRVNLGIPSNTQPEGQYGFRLVPVSGAGLSDGIPVPGDAPDIRVVVDVTAPVVRIFPPAADPADPTPDLAMDDAARLGRARGHAGSDPLLRHLEPSVPRVFPHDGSNVRRLTYEGDYNAAPAWSPRGNWIAYVCRTAQRTYKLCMVTPDGQKRVQITTGNGIDDSPSWSPDGRHLTFSSTVDGKSHIYMVNTDGTDLERITFGGTHNSAPSWSPAL